MKLVKSLLLGSAAGLTAVAGAQAADLPVKKAVAVEYVRVCTAYGAGFFYIPGTDTCLRVTGFAQAAYQYTASLAPRPDVSGFRSMGRIALDARTDTAYGTLRTFIRMDMRNGSGSYLHSGTAVRYATAFTGTGVDTVGRLQTYVELDKAFIQFAGFTAGRAASFFDFYAAAHEIIGASYGSNVSATNLFAYTATFGGGLSATISVEDPTWRRQPVFNAFGFGGAGTAASQGFGGLTAQFSNPALGFTQTTPVATVFNAAGTPVAYQLLDIAQRNRVPDFVGNIRLDQPWGSAQLSVATHEIFVGAYQGGLFNSGLVGPGVQVPGQAAGIVTGAANTAIAGAVTPAAQIPSAEYGYAVQGGVKLNLPMLGAGDTLYLQAAYAKGALRYTNPYGWNGSEANSISGMGRLNFNTNDAVVLAGGQLELSESWSATASYRHFWIPTVSTAIWGSIGGIDYPGAARVGAGPVVAATLFPGATAAQFAAATNTAVLRDVRFWQVGANVNWTPVRGLDIGLEAVYNKIEINALAPELAKSPATLVGHDDHFMTRLRIQREF